MAIQIIGNVGTVGYALPMVSASPLDVNSQYLLAWNPTAAALDYIPYVGNILGDFTISRDLTVTRNALVGGTLGVAGAATFAGILTAGPTAPLAAVIPFITGPLTATGIIQGVSLKAVNGANNAEFLSDQVKVQTLKVVGARDTGWAALTGTPQKTTGTTGAITLPQLAGVVMALQTALIAHGLIGA